MFEKFGEFDSADEINKKAQELLKKNDEENLKVLAKENGIGEEMVALLISGVVRQLCDDELAAFGKIEMEVEDLKAEEIMFDWAEYIKGCIVKEPAMASAVRRKGKSLKGCISELLKWSFKNAKQVDKEICKLANVPEKVTLGIPGMGRAKQIIRGYYLGK